MAQEQKYIRTEYAGGAVTLSNIRDKFTGEPVTYDKVTVFSDGSVMDDSKCDGVIYRKLGSEYFKRNFSGAVNVRWFGAKGDAITDDTQAVQKAIDIGAFSIIFPDGTFLVSELLCTTNAEFKGMGVKRTTLKLKDGGDFIIEFGVGNDTKRPYLKDMKLESTDFQGTGIKFRNCSDFKLEGVEITGFNEGVLSEGSLAYTVNDCKISDCNIGYKLISSRDGDTFDSPPNLVSIRNSFFTGCQEWCIYFDFGSALSIEHVNFDFTGDNSENTGAIYVGESTSTYESYSRYNGVSISHSWFEGIRGRWLDVRSGSVAVSFVNTYACDFPAYINTNSEFITFINVIGADANAGLKINKDNTALVFINSLLTNGVSTITGEPVNEKNLFINSRLVDGSNEGFGNIVRFLNGLVSNKDVSVGGNTNGGKFDNAKMYLGDIAFWRENGGQLRFKQGVPNGETDGFRVADLISNGSTGSRPASPVNGQNFFDNTLGKPVWYKSSTSSWVDATGANV